MLLSDSQLLGAVCSEMVVKIISPDGRILCTRFPMDASVEQVKNRAVDYFFPVVTTEQPTPSTSGSRYKLVRVSDSYTLHEFFSLQREQVTEQDELLLIERALSEPVKLWDLCSVHAPAPAAIAAATAGLASPRPQPPHPDLQTLLTTNEVTRELQKILISLIEAGARLAAGGRNYEETLQQLSRALDPPPAPRSAPPPPPAHNTPPPQPASLLSRGQPNTSTQPEHSSDTFKRAECLQNFLDKFRTWRHKVIVSPMPDGVETLKQLGFTETEANLAFQHTGSNEPAAALWLVGERGSSIFELVNGLPDGAVLQALLKQPVIQRGLLNTRMLLAFISIVGQAANAALWLNAPHGGPLLQQILRTYHSEKYCSAVNQYTSRRLNDPASPNTSRPH